MGFGLDEFHELDAVVLEGCCRSVKGLNCRDIEKRHKVCNIAPKHHLLNSDWGSLLAWKVGMRMPSRGRAKLKRAWSEKVASEKETSRVDSMLISARAAKMRRKKHF